MNNKIISFLDEEEGTSMAEYALLLGLITVTIVVVLSSLGTRLSGAFNNATTAIPS